MNDRIEKLAERADKLGDEMDALYASIRPLLDKKAEKTKERLLALFTDAMDIGAGAAIEGMRKHLDRVSSDMETL